MSGRRKRRFPGLHYFQCSLPRRIPAWYRPEIREELKRCSDTVYRRTAQLNAACDRASAETGMKPSTFHALAGTVFRTDPERFDAMGADGLCRAAELLYSGKEEPDREEWPHARVLYDTAFVTGKEWETLRHFGIGGCATCSGGKPEGRTGGSGRRRLLN